MGSKQHCGGSMGSRLGVSSQSQPIGTTFSTRIITASMKPSPYCMANDSVTPSEAERLCGRAVSALFERIQLVDRGTYTLMAPARRDVMLIFSV